MKQIRLIFILLIGIFIFLSPGIHAQDKNSKERINQLLETADSLPAEHLNKAREALHLAKQNNHSALRGKAHMQIGISLQAKSNFTEATPYFDSAKTIFRENNRNDLLLELHSKAGKNQIALGNFSRANEIFSRALTLAELLNDSSSTASCLEHISYTLLRRGKVNDALTYNERALRIAEAIDNSLRIAQCRHQMGLIYAAMNKPYEALRYHENALKRFKRLDNKEGIAHAHTSIGNIHNNMGSFDRAMDHFKTSYIIAKNKQNQAQIADNLKGIGNVFYNKGQLQEAFSYYNRALKHARGLQSKYTTAGILLQLGKLNNKNNNYTQAISLLSESLELYQTTGAIKGIAEALKHLAKSYNNAGNTAKAYFMLSRYSKMQDSIHKIERTKRLKKIEQAYEERKSEQQIRVQQAEIARKNAEIKNQQIKQNALIASIFMMLVLVGLITFFYIQKRKSNKAIKEQNNHIRMKNAQLLQKNEEITSQRDEITNQRDEIMYQKDEIEKQKDEIDRQRNTLLWQTKEITDSILYARYIQQAMLPAEQLFEDTLESYFIFFKPRDIVSGDFYWAKRVNNLTYIAAVDCSGHGVPGAFMSMLGFAFLNEIVNYKNPLHANDVLDELRTTVKDALAQTEAKEGTREGMSISLCVINHEEQTMEFSGAFNPLYQFRDGELTRHEADRQPVAIYFNEKPFTKKTLHYQPGDTFYIFSDGYSDQFGGEHGKKYKKKPFQQLLLQIHQESMDAQKEIINKNLTQWMGGGYEQVDDILVIGFRII